MNGIHGAEGNESKRYLPIYLHGKMNFGFVPMVSVISAPKGLQTGWQSSWISGRASQYHYRIFKAGRILYAVNDGEIHLCFKVSGRKRTDGM